VDASLVKYLLGGLIGLPLLVFTLALLGKGADALVSRLSRYPQWVTVAVIFGIIGTLFGVVIWWAVHH